MPVSVVLHAVRLALVAVALAMVAAAVTLIPVTLALAAVGLTVAMTVAAAVRYLRRRAVAAFAARTASFGPCFRARLMSMRC